MSNLNNNVKAVVNPSVMASKEVQITMPPITHKINRDYRRRIIKSTGVDLKGLETILDSGLSSLNSLCDYLQVDADRVRTIIKTYKDELKEYGFDKRPYTYFVDNETEVEQVTKWEVRLSKNGNTITLYHIPILTFTREAALCIALLSSSPVADKLRVDMVNDFNNSPKYSQNEDESEFNDCVMEVYNEDINRAYSVENESDNAVDVIEDNVSIFNSEEFGQVRTLRRGTEVWFVGKDVAQALGYGNARDAIAAHVDDLDKGVAFSDTLGGKQQITIINESGMYALIFGSRLESAKRFKRWVTSEVLPQIHRTGSYNPTTQDALLCQEIGRAIMNGDMDGLAKSVTKLVDYKNSQIQTLGTDNKKLAQGILTWDERSRINFAMRKFAVSAYKPMGWAYNELYKQLKNKFSIDLKKRAGDTKTPYISHVKQNEWKYVTQAFSALCEAHGLSSTDMFYNTPVLIPADEENASEVKNEALSVTEGV